MNDEQPLGHKSNLGRKPLSDEAKQEAENRRIHMVTMLKQNKISLTVLASRCGIDVQQLSNYNTGRIRLTLKRWEFIKQELEILIAARIVKPYVIRMLEYNGKTIIQKSRIAGQETQYLDYLALLGFKCELEHYGALDRCYTIRLIRKLTKGK